MNIQNEQLQELTKLGYTERESAFLYTVATFSGHFLRKQFERFLAVSHGQPAHDFIQKCIQQDHVHEVPYMQSNHRRYHLFSRVIYRAIGKENSANRKAGSECKANSKLRVLEFVLSHFKYEYLEEESDKVAFFTTRKNIGIDVLPVKVFDGKVPGQNTTRYFIDKFPILLGESKSDRELIPAFTYFEHEYASLDNFAAHLRSYKPLLDALDGRYRFIYVAEHNKHFDRAQKLFHSVLSSPASQPFFPLMLAYFRLRRLWEEKRLDQLSDQDYVTLNRGEKRFAAPEYQALYQQWQAGELESKIASQVPPKSEPPVDGIFFTRQVIL